MVDGAIADIGHVDFAVGRFAKGYVAEALQVVVAGGGPAAQAIGDDVPEVAGAVVGEDVMAVHVGILAAAVDVAAAYRAAIGMAVFIDGEGVVGDGAAAAGVVGVVAFVAAPAVVDAAGRPGRLKIDLFPGVLPHVGNPEVAGEAVEASAPGVAHAHGPDFVAGGGAAAHVGVVVGNGVAAAAQAHAVWRDAGAAVDVDAADFAQEGGEGLGVVLRVAAAAAITQGDVEVAVGAKMDVAGVVVGVGLVDGEENAFAGGVGDVGVAGDAEARDARA